MVNSVTPPPKPEVQGLGEVLFPGSNVPMVNFVMHNPFRELGKMQVDVMESLMAGILSTGGDPNNVLYSLFNVMLERADDPIKFMKMAVHALMNPKSLQFPSP